MPAALGVGAGAVDVLLIFLALLAVALALRVIIQAQGTVSGWPLIGGRLHDLLQGIEDGLLALARVVVGAAVQLAVWAVQLIHAGISAIVTIFTYPIAVVANGLLLAVQVVEADVKAVARRVQQLADDAENAAIRAFKKQFPHIPDPLGLLGRLLARAVIIIAVAEALIDVLSPLLLLFGRVHDLEVLGKNLIYENEQLQKQLAVEKAARLYGEQQLQQAQRAATAAQDATRRADKAQWAPLLALGVLAALSASGINVLRKTAQCDPCGQLDQLGPDLDERISALEAFGEG